MKYFVLIVCFVVNIIAAQQNAFVDFKSAIVDVSIQPIAEQVQGSVLYTFDILKNTDSIVIDAKNFKHIAYVLDGQYRGDLYRNNQLVVKHPFKANTAHQIEVEWVTSPKKAMYFIDWGIEGGKEQVWTQGQGKYTSNWLPSFDDMNEKVEFDLSVSFHKDYEVIANGKLVDKQVNDSITTWHYDMQNPMPSYLLALAIGKYEKKLTYSNSSVPLEMYYYPEDSLKFEPTYRYTKQIFDFLEEEIDVPYPWQNYKQIPVKDFLYAGMENTSATIFADNFVIDSIAFVDKNYVNVNAHELAHQWFGDLVTASSGTHHWLQEGFATYYALLAEKEVFGEDYYYWQLYEYAQELLKQDKAGESTSLLNPKSSSITFYKKGAWVLHLLREKIGDAAFKLSVKNYLLKHQFMNVETNDFISEVEKVSGEDLKDFVDKWLKASELYYDEMEGYFYLTSVNYKKYLQLDCTNTPEDCFDFIINNENDFLKASIVKKLKGNFAKDLMQIDTIKIRQALAESFSKIPLGLKGGYESFLNDESYKTIEVALFNLWRNFPDDRAKYLSKTKGIQGFNNKNIRILWLALALVTEDYEPENKKHYFNELTEYTSPKYGFEIRQQAFQYLKDINACYNLCVENLKQGTTHHNWRFKKFAQTLLKDK